MEKLLAAFHQMTGKPPRYLFFDEIQRLPSWSRVVRTLHNTRKYSIVVTGSNATLLSSEIATELRGRYEDCLILPFSFREFLRIRKIEWTPALLATPEVGLVLKAFDEYLRYGGFPELAGLIGEAAKRRLLQSYFDTIFYKDILDRHGIRARHLLDIVMKNILESYASAFSISAFEKQLKGHGLAGSKRSIADYLRYLEEAFFLIVIEKFDFSPRKRMMNPKKVYLTDTGFSLLGGAFSENRGRLLENVVAIELIRNRRRAMYFRGKGECDFIVQAGSRPAEAWQVCWEINRSNEKREMSGLAAARRELGVKKSGILTYNQEGTRTLDGAKIPLIPVWKWLFNAQLRA
jgi:predicted AAA+ superfamily ATPase